MSSGKVSAVKILAASAVGCLIVWAAFPNGKASDLPAQSDGATTEDGTLIRGLRYKTYKNGFLVARVEAEEFKIIPRRFFVFRIKSLNEAVITNARMDLFFQRGETHNSSFLHELTRKESGAGLVTRVTVKGIDISIYDSDVLTHRIRAASADLRDDTGQGIFYDATLEEPSSGKSVKARKVVWDSREKKFKIAGNYEASASQMKSDGKVPQIGLRRHYYAAPAQGTS